MSVVAWIFLAAAVAYGAFWFLKRGRKHGAEQQARADREARSARHDAQAIQRSIDGRR